MRAAAILLLLALGLTGSVISPAATEGAPETPLRATGLAAAAPGATLAEAPSCVPALEAARAATYIALSWTSCPGVERYLVFRGPSAAELVSIVEVNHPSHIDLTPALVTAVYAVATPGGALSDPVAIALG